MDAVRPWSHIFGGREEQRVSGSLSLLPPLLLLEAAERNGQDCRLTMRDPSGGSVLIALFRGGRPTMVFSPGDGRSVGELLLDAGLIDRALLSELLRSRAVERGPLERLLRERTGLDDEELQRFFDFQARARLLEALAWRAGSFELERYTGDDESEFRLQLPSFQTLAMRAQARAEALADLLPNLPASPERLLVRRRNASAKPGDDIQAAVLRAVDEPRLVPQLVARLLCDDDLVVRAVMELVRARGVVVQPRASAVPDLPRPEDGEGSFSGELLSAVVRRLRGGDGFADPALWMLVVGEGSGPARELVTRLGGSGGGEPLNGTIPSTTVARARVRVARDAMLCAVAVEPESLSRGAIDPLLSRFDVLCAVREEAGTPRLDALLEHLAPGVGPMVVGVDLGGRGRSWPAQVRAVLTIPDVVERHSRDLAGLLIELLHGAASQA